MLSVDPKWTTAMANNPQPVVLARLDLGPVAFLRITDTTTIGGYFNLVTNAGTVSIHRDEFYSALGSGATINNFLALFAQRTRAQSVNVHCGFYRSGAIVFVPNDSTITSMVVSLDVSVGWIASPSPVLQSYWIATDDSIAAEENGYLGLINNIGSVSGSIDPITREVTIGSVTIEVHRDILIEDILSRYRYRGRKVQLFLGAIGLDVSNYVPIGAYLIDEILVKQGSISIECVEPCYAIQDGQVHQNFLAMHPVSAIVKILQLSYFEGSIDTSVTMDNGSSYWTSRNASHWVVNRNSLYGGTQTGFDYTYNDDQEAPKKLVNAIPGTSNAKNEIDSICSVCGISFYPDEYGTYRVSLYDSTASKVTHWTKDQYQTIEQTHAVSNQSADVQIFGADVAFQAADGVSAAPCIYRARNIEAARSYGNTGKTAKNVTKLQSSWIGMPCFYQVNSSATPTVFQSGDTSIDLYPMTIAGISGTRANTAYSFTSATPPQQASHETINSDRPIYLFLTDGTNTEYVYCDQTPSYIKQAFAIALDDTYVDDNFIVQNNTVNYPAVANDPQFSSSGLTYSQVLTITVNRGAFGTAPQPFRLRPNAQESLRIYDITIAKRTADTILNRFAWGAPSIEITTGLEQWPVQLGDFVSVDCDCYTSLGRTAADSNVIFEVVSKELVMSGEYYVKFTLVWVRDDVGPYASSNPLLPIPQVSNTISGLVTNSSGTQVVDSSGNTIVF